MQETCAGFAHVAIRLLRIAREKFGLDEWSDELSEFLQNYLDYWPRRGRIHPLAKQTGGNMLGASYKTKKQLKESVGKPLRYEETSLFGPEYRADGKFNVVGPSPYERKWYATVTMENGLIKKVT